MSYTFFSYTNVTSHLHSYNQAIIAKKSEKVRISTTLQDIEFAAIICSYLNCEAVGDELIDLINLIFHRKLLWFLRQILIKINCTSFLDIGTTAQIKTTCIYLVIWSLICIQIYVAK